MISRVQLSALLFIAISSVAISLLIAGKPVSWSWFASIGIAVSVTWTALTIFNNWIWKLPLLQGWFVQRPNLSGEWDFTIKSLWVNPDTGKPPDPILAIATIRQTFADIHMRLETKESKGDFISASIVRKNDGEYTLAAVYRNEPRPERRGLSAIHHGSLLLEIIGDAKSPIELRGEYWTSRETLGEVVAQRRKA